MCVYIYIYVCVCIYICVCIYQEREVHSFEAYGDIRIRRMCVCDDVGTPAEPRTQAHRGLIKKIRYAYENFRRGIYSGGTSKIRYMHMFISMYISECINMELNIIIYIINK
jgi:hypothetical protein